MENGQVYFCGSDVAKALGYSNPPDALSRHCRAIVKRDTPISGKMQAINFIPEGDLYRLIINSKLESSYGKHSSTMISVVTKLVSTDEKLTLTMFSSGQSVM